jgi:hypothetical protein
MLQQCPCVCFSFVYAIGGYAKRVKGERGVEVITGIHDEGVKVKVKVKSVCGSFSTYA